MFGRRKVTESGGVVLLTIEGPASRLLANVLHESGLLRGIVIESRLRRSRVSRVAHRILRRLSASIGARSTAKPRSMPERRFERERLNAAQDRVTADYPTAYRRWPANVARLTVDDMNGDRCRSALENWKPDAIAVFRTKVLRREIFGQARIGTVNCHYSLLPEYRGNFVEFFQVMNGDLHTAGVTFHFIDDGVDTGDIIESLPHVDLPDECDPFELRYRNYRMMLDYFPSVLASVVEGRCERRPQPPSEARAYRRADITPQRQRELYSRFGMLPAESGVVTEEIEATLTAQSS